MFSALPLNTILLNFYCFGILLATIVIGLYQNKKDKEN